MSGWLASGGWQSIGTVVLIALLVAAAGIDIRRHRIPNLLVFSGAGIALLLAHLPGGSVSGWLSGIVVGLAMGLPLYWLRAMGAGDVKLMAMAGAFLGGTAMFAAALVTFVIGALLGLAVVARRHAFARLGTNMKDIVLGALSPGVSAVQAPGQSVGALPYGVAIAAGTILYLAISKGGVFQ